MLKFLIGVVVGVFLGVLVVAPNPEWTERVQGLWADARAWAVGFWSAAEDAAGDAADRAEELADEVEDEAREAVDEIGREAGEATR